MALTSRERNMVIGIVAVLVIAAIAAAFFLGRKSDDDKATTATTPTATQTTPTATTPTTATVVQTVTQTPQPQPGAGVEIVEQSINPADTTRGAPVVLTVRTRGPVTSVRMDINGREPKAVELAKGPTVNDITNWAATSTAPGLAGAYTYKAIAIAADGTAKEGPASTFTVLP